jgi:2,4-dienoyl-CoA reductase-like NADH-dependent reductase (Old Yellow Enzyme family)
LIISEATSISKQGHGWPGAPGIYTDAQVGGWRKVTDSVHAHGGKIFVQLWHMGSQSHSSFFGLRPVSASAIQLAGKATLNSGAAGTFELPKAMEASDIAQLMSEFKQAAECAKQAGFDGIELHGANGYLLDQFMQSVTNQRTDGYGGSFENRFRIVGEVLDAVLRVFPANRVGLRISPNGMIGGMGSADNADMFTHVAQQAERFKLGYVHLIDGAAFGVHKQGPLLQLADVRRVYRAGALIGNCGYSPQSAEAAVSAGDADMIAIGRPYMSNPDLVERVANNWCVLDTVSLQCVSCHQ